MTQATRGESPSTPRTIPQTTTQPAGKTFGAGYLFGVPVGDLGIFASLLISTAAGFGAFFASTFFAIFGVLFYNSSTHHAVDFGLTYRLVGLPVGVAVLVIALGYLGTLWVRRKIKG